MDICICGCNEEIEKGNFKTGHDQKLRISLEKNIGGIVNLKTLVESSVKYNKEQISLNDFGKIVHQLLT